MIPRVARREPQPRALGGRGWRRAFHSQRAFLPIPSGSEAPTKASDKIAGFFQESAELGAEFRWLGASRPCPAGFWTSHPHAPRQYLRWFADRVGISRWEQFYSLTSRAFLAQPGGGSLVAAVGQSSLLALLRHALPEHQWLPWKFISVPQNWWNSPENGLSYVTWLRREVGLDGDLSQCYHLTHAIVSQHGGHRWLRKHGSLSAALGAVYPGHRFRPWLFAHPPRHFWARQANIAEFFDWFKQEHGIKTLEDFYSLARGLGTTLKASGGAALLEQYGGSELAVMEAAYPSHGWRAWEFRAPTGQGGVSGLFAQQADLRRFFDQFKSSEQPEGLEAMYALKYDQILAAGGSFLSGYETVEAAVRAAYPEHDWQPWKFRGGAGREFWASAANQSRFLSWLTLRFKISSPGEWYSVSEQAVAAEGGRGLLGAHGGSLARAVLQAFPHVPWKSWLFYSPPRNWANSKVERQRYVEWLCTDRLGWSLADVGNLTKLHLRLHHGSQVSTYYGHSVGRMVGDLFPHLPSPPKRRRTSTSPDFKLKAPPRGHQKQIESFVASQLAQASAPGSAQSQALPAPPQLP